MDYTRASWQRQKQGLFNTPKFQSLRQSCIADRHTTSTFPSVLYFYSFFPTLILMKLLLRSIEYAPSVLRRGVVSRRTLVRILIRPHSEQQQLFSFQVRREESWREYFFSFWRRERVYQSMSLSLVLDLWRRLPRLTFQPYICCFLRNYSIYQSINANIIQITKQEQVSVSIGIISMRYPLVKSQQCFQQFPQMQSYQYSQSPLVSPQKKLQIEQKLQLEKVAMNNVKDRDTNSEYYIKYNWNPFLELKGRGEVLDQKLMKLVKNNTVNIVNKMAEMDINGVRVKPDVYVQRDKVNKMENQTMSFGEKMIAKMKKMEMDGEKGQESAGRKQRYVVKDEKVSKYKKGRWQEKQKDKDKDKDKERQKEKEKDKEKQKQIKIEIDEQPKTVIDIETKLSKQQTQKIVTYKQPNFFMQSQNTKINIFKIGNDSDDDLSPKQILQNYYFCHNSIYQRISKMKIPIYRDISSFGRQLIMGKRTMQDPVDYIETIELSYKLTQLIYCDVMSVASNRFCSQFVYKLLNGQQTIIKQVSDTTSEERDEHSIILLQNQRNVQKNFINPNEQIQEISDYRILQLNENQVQYYNKCQRKLMNIIGSLDLKKELISKTVMDGFLHRNIEQVVNDEMKDFIQMDTRVKQPGRLVRMNKTYKSKTEFIKIKALLATLEYKNQQDQMMRSKDNCQHKIE